MKALRGQGPYLGQAESRNKRNRIYIFTYNLCIIHFKMGLTVLCDFRCSSIVLIKDYIVLL